MDALRGQLVATLQVWLLFMLEVWVVKADAIPVLGHDNAVAGVTRIVADLDGKVNAQVADVVGEARNILGALVRDPGDAVAVDEHVRREQIVWRNVEGAADAVILRAAIDADDAAIDDAASNGEGGAALEFNLLGRFTLAQPGIGEQATHGEHHRSRCAYLQSADTVEMQSGWKMREHGTFVHRIDYQGSQGC